MVECENCEHECQTFYNPHIQVSIDKLKINSFKEFSKILK